MSKSRKPTVSSTLDPAVIEYLDKLAAEQERTRSQMINLIIKEHASRNGYPIPPKGQQDGDLFSPPKNK